MIESSGTMGLDSHILLFGAAGGAVGRSAASAGGACSALKLSPHRKGESRHDSSDFLALTFGTSNLFGAIQHQFFEFVFALVTLIFKDRHLGYSFKIKDNIF